MCLMEARRKKRKRSDYRYNSKAKSIRFVRNFNLKTRAAIYPKQKDWSRQDKENLYSQDPWFGVQWMPERHPINTDSRHSTK